MAVEAGADGPAAAGASLKPAVRILSNIQILRGVAALMVLGYHIGNELSDRGFRGPLPTFWTGSGGVDVFFVISGFIMVYSTGPAFAKPGAGPVFLLRRAARLVPLYWLITTLWLLPMLHDARHAGLPPATWKWIAASYLFLFFPHAPDDDFPLYTQGWTLNFEMFFYVCFAVALRLRRSRAVAVLSVGLLAFSGLGLAVDLPWPLDRFSNTNIVEFVLGMGLAEAHRRGLRSRLVPALACAAAGLAFMAATIDSVDGWLPYRGFVWGPPALAIVAAAALYEPTRRSRARGVFEALGDASYSLYLVHFAVFRVVSDCLGSRIDLVLPHPLRYAALLFVVAILAAFATYRFVERPMTRALDRGLGLSRRWRAVVSRSPRSAPERTISLTKS